MKLWERTGQSKAAKAGVRSPHVLLRDGGVDLVLGMAWSPVLGSKALHVARRKAAEDRASHYLLLTVPGRHAVGTAKLTRKEAAGLGKRAVYSGAAALAGLRGAGMTVGCFELDDGRIWMASIRDGLVQSKSDVIFDEADDAYAQLAAYRDDADKRGSSLTVFGNIDHVDEPMQLAELAGGARLALQARHFSLDQLPKPVRVSLGLLGALVVLHFGYGYYQDWQKRRELAQLRANMQDPTRAWAQAVAKEGKSKRVDSRDSLGALYDGMADVPMRIAGWALKSFFCVPAGSKWSCSAKYHRTRYGTTNNSLAEALPDDWKVSFAPLEDAQVNWTISGSAPKLGVDVSKLPRRDEVYLDPVSDLQRILPAFKLIRLTTPVPWTVPVPIDGNNHPISKPSTFPLPGAIQVRMTAPLRSLSVWDLTKSPTAVKRVEVTLDPTSEEVGLDTSVLMMNVTGDIYVRNAK